MKIEIVSYDELSGPQKNRVAKTYDAVFSSSPWNEAFKCPGCGTFHGLNFSSGDTCLKNCGGQIEKTYNRKQVRQELDDEANKPGALALAAIQENGMPIGLSIGFPWTYEEFAANKYGEQYQQSMADFFESQGLSGPMFYGSDVFVDPKIQCKGVGTLLTLPWEQKARQLGLDFVFRTNTDSGMAKIGMRELRVEQFFGKQVILEPQPNGRIELRTVDGSFVNGIDPQSENRILMRKAYNQTQPKQASARQILMSR